MNNIIHLLHTLLIPLEVALVITAFLVTTSDSIQKVITTYRIQCILLAVVTGATAITRAPPGINLSVLIIFFIFIFILPIMLAIFIELLLIRATVSDLPGHKPDADARQVWLKYKATRSTQAHSIWFLALVLLAFLIAFQIFASGLTPAGPSRALLQQERIGLMVFLALHLTGLYNLVIKHDIISQVIGLLTMDHGLYLAAVKIVAIPVPAGFFVLSLYFYTLITIFILVFLLPRVRRFTRTIDLSEIADSSHLKG